MSRKLVRRIRNISNSQAEIKIKGATSNDSFGPTTTELHELALLTHNDKQSRDITNVLSKRLNDNSRNWRHILKCLTVIQYCLLTGSLDFVEWMRKNGYLVSTLQEFELKGHDDIAHQIRTKSKSIVKLLKDDTLMEEKRIKFHSFRSSMSRPSMDLRGSLDLGRTNREDELDLEEQNVLTGHMYKGSRSLLEMGRKSTDSRTRDEVLQSLTNIQEE